MKKTSRIIISLILAATLTAGSAVTSYAESRESVATTDSAFDSDVVEAQSFSSEYTIPESSAVNPVVVTDGSTVTVSNVSSTQTKWLKVTCESSDYYKLAFTNTDGSACDSMKFAVRVLSDGKLYSSVYDRNVDNNYYYYQEEGAVLYIECGTKGAAASYNVTFKKVITSNGYDNESHARSVRNSTKASTIAEAQAQGTIDYLNAMYKNEDIGLRIDHADSVDKAALVKMAKQITDGCTTDVAKVEAIYSWVDKNIKYDTSAGSYSTSVFRTRRGDCYGVASITSDFCKAIGIRSAIVFGWVDVLSKYSIDELNGRTGHAWNMIYLDGKWRMYDVVMGRYNISDPSEIAAVNHLSYNVEGVAIVGPGVDPALAGYGRSYQDLICTAYYEGKVCQLWFGKIFNYGSVGTVDQDGVVFDIEDVRQAINKLWVDDRYYPSLTCTVKDNVIRDYDYSDGSALPATGINLTNGWVNYGKMTNVAYADPDSILRNMDLGEYNGKAVYFNQSGNRIDLNMDSDQYYLQDANLYIKLGTSGKLFSPLGYNVTSYDLVEAFDMNGKKVDLSQIISIASDGTITTVGTGSVWLNYRIIDGTTDDSGDLQFVVTSKDKPNYSFSDTITPSKVTLSTTKYTYDGKAKSPTVKAYTSSGSLISAENYIVTKPSGRTAVGKYYYTVEFTNGYTGTYIVPLTIVPKSTSITSLARGSKSFTVKWSKRTTQTTGYQVRYSTKSSMGGAKTVTITKAGTTSRKISSLKAKKKYYVQVRTYKTVAGVKYYSDWSAKKSVTTK